MAGVMLVLDTPENAPSIAPKRFDLIERSRAHLGQHGDTTAASYPNVHSVLERILHPPTGVIEYRYSIFDAETNEMAGFIKLTRVSRWQVEVGYWLGAGFEGMGYMVTAVHMITHIAIAQLGFTEVLAWVHPDNERSMRVLRSNKYEDEGPDLDRDGLVKFSFMRVLCSQTAPLGRELTPSGHASQPAGFLLCGIRRWQRWPEFWLVTG